MLRLHNISNEVCKIKNSKKLTNDNNHINTQHQPKPNLFTFTVYTD
jgi:hypothetical protein